MKARVLGFLGSILPFAIVAGLMYAAIFVKIEPDVKIVDPPLIAARDRIYGVASHGDKVWIAGNHGKVLQYSANAGGWRMQPSGLQTTLQGIAAWDDRHLVAVGEEMKIIVTDDGGDHWRTIEAPEGIDSRRLLRVRATGEREGYALGDMGLVLATRDRGATWQVDASGEDVGWNDIAVAGDVEIKVGEFGRISRRGDNGQWEAVETGADRSLTGVAINPDNPLQAVAVGLDGLALSSSDGGRTWDALDTGIREHLFAITVNERGWVAFGDRSVRISGSFGNPGVTRMSPLPSEPWWYADAVPFSGGLLAVGRGVCFITRSSECALDMGSHVGQ